MIRVQSQPMHAVPMQAISMHAGLAGGAQGLRKYHVAGCIWYAPASNKYQLRGDIYARQALPRTGSDFLPVRTPDPVPARFSGAFGERKSECTGSTTYIYKLHTYAHAHTRA